MRIRGYIVLCLLVSFLRGIDTAVASFPSGRDTVEMDVIRKKQLSTDSTKTSKKELGKITRFIYNTIRITPRNPAEEQRLLERENSYIANYTGRTIGEIYIYQNNVFEESKNGWTEH